MKSLKTLYSQLLTTIMITILLVTPQTLKAQPEPAFSGYDLVSYFEKNTAELGQQKFAYQYKKSNYYFSSERHMTLFKRDPEHYLPQFDGYCAYGVTFGKKLEASPEAWMIVDDKLYFNLNQSFLKKWADDADASILIGNEQWIQIK